MPSSYSTNLRFELQFTGENINTWGDRLDATFSRVDDSIAGYVAITLTGDYTITAANSNTTADEARRAHLKFNGALAASATITIPGVSKSYWIWNNTDKTLTITAGAGTTATVDAGDVLQVWCDGTNVKSTTYAGFNLKDYIAAMTLAATGSLPATTGNNGKFLGVVGGSWVPVNIATTDITSFNAAVDARAIAFALAF